ncbi:MULTISPECIES: UvrD-helicase domain-containing protein [Pontibacillus]|uniref:DNA 3'-5' helicase n=1 Tax=Pontibacillus chungwhensis TaxID=265426 RepID=A0ABY8UYB4_9BACI|nr:MULTISPECIES: UvrD-helicase domain-containing protein [Pontibacillus]MCD5325380.1 UvrD-helicase domain-containing protein [Pontibacillus sp. HN14]WIF98497.1 UvrD-helicase domain-containing protein [Pontibacillus chungwhensis]
MQDLFHKIKLFINKIQYRDFSVALKQDLTKWQHSKESLWAKSLALKNQTEIITNHQIETLQETYNEVLKDQPLKAITNSSIHKHLEQLRTLPIYKDYEEKRNEHKKAIRSLLIKLPSIQETRNKVITMHTVEAYTFMERVDLLKKSYITHSHKQSLLASSYQNAYDFFEGGHPDRTIQQFNGLFENLSEKIKDWNKHYIDQELRNNQHFFNNIDGKSLDHQQRVAIVTDEDSNLILAGAGSGKTLTISGKVKYLIERKGIKPEEILLISFTKKAAGEMHERIAKKLGVEIDVKTFHKLGLEIISEAGNEKPDIEDSMDAVLHTFFKEQMHKHKNYIHKLMHFFGVYLKIPKDISDFNTLGEYHEYHKNLDFETLKGKAHKQQEHVKQSTDQLAAQKKTYQGETVKSLEEFIIANFLYLNGISYTYEKPYEYLTGNQQYRQYKPDFYLDDYGLYLEHFGIDENMRAPHLSAIEEERYLEDLKWKRELHKENETRLLETYSYYNREGILLEELERMLKEEGVVFQPIDSKKLFSQIFDHLNNTYFQDLKKLVKTFITLFKSSGYGAEDFQTLEKQNKRNLSLFMRKRNEIFFSLVKPIYHYYEKSLASKNAIDFNDMINRATSIIEETKPQFPYKYIIVDEYQDISQSRFHLINAIRKQTGAKVMCVGDDWQSIYRFAGSDIELFTNFEAYFGDHELLRIEKTYRNSQQLIDTAGQFVMKNPSQYKKNLRSDKTNETPIRMFLFKNRQIIQRLEDILDEVVAAKGTNQTIMLLGRNNYDILIFEKSPDFYAQHKSGKVTYKKYPNLSIQFLSVHKSKGLEADYVILLNAKNGKTGFPNKIEDDPVLEWVLQTKDQFLFSEERRLFYTAITRTQNSTYILVPEKSPSSFVKELKEEYNIAYETGGHVAEETLKCPRCHSGDLTIRNDSFVGCSNYPQCGYTINDVSVLEHQKKCSRCGGFMAKRKNKSGEYFYGCSNYPLCSQTENIE